MKYKVYLDSNQVFNEKPLGEVFNLAVLNLRQFLDDHGLSDIDICLPEIVIRERLQQKLEDIQAEIESVNKALSALRALGHQNKDVVPLSSYRETLEGNVKEHLIKYNIKRIPIPLIDKNELVERALNKMRPFNDNGAGFKDTLIYFSIVEDALGLTPSDRYIFSTNDGKEFNAAVCDEFKTVTGKELYIVPAVVKISEKLDELIPLRLHLEERNSKIKNFILTKLGDLMKAVNASGGLSSYGDAFSFGRRRVNAVTDATVFYNPFRATYSDVGEEEEEEGDEFVVGYNFADIDFSSFSEVREGDYAVQGVLRTLVQTKVLQKPKKRNSGLYGTYDATSVGVYNVVSAEDLVYRPYELPRYKRFEFELRCDLGSDTMHIVKTLGLLY